QRTMFSGVFRSTPATYIRLPMPVRGGPTNPCASEMPATVWHDPQPYLKMAERPRAGSPPVTVAPAACAPELHAVHSAAAPAIEHTPMVFVNLLRIPPPRHHCLAFAYPLCE